MTAAGAGGQLGWERANARWAGPAAFAAAVLVLVSFLLPKFFGGNQPRNLRDQLIWIHEHSGVFVASSVIQGLAFVALAAVFIYMMRAIGARREEAVNFLRPVVFAAPVLLLVGLVLGQMVSVDLADKFVAGGPQTVDRAKALVRGSSQVGPIVNALGGLFLAVSFVLVSVNGMRAGLFSRFIGIVGAIAGALVVLSQLVPGAIIQFFWIGSLGFLILDRWPNGRGPAWSAVQAIPWPSASAVARGGAAAPDPAPAEEPAPDQPDGPVNPRAGRKKKKRKRR